MVGLEDIVEYMGAFAAGILFCMAVWLLLLQCGGVFGQGVGEVLRDFEVMYAR